jgi:hypothetical protein
MTLAVSIAQSGANNVTMRNRIINGAMMIDQRNAGASVSATNGAYTLDRWATTSYDGAATTGKFTVQQNAGSVTPPTGFKNYLGVTSSAATSVSSNGVYAVSQSIEGLNMADFGWGAVGAVPVTVSFWVRSSLTGAFGGVLSNSAGDYNYPFQYTISSANTWEYKTVTIAGPTAGTWLSTNGIGINVRFGLGAGTLWTEPAGAWTTSIAYSADSSVSVVGTNGATFYITGVQLEEGTTATAFEQRLYGTEYALCQRYFQTATQNTATAISSGAVLYPWNAMVSMRTRPSAAIGGSGAYSGTVVYYESAPWLTAGTTTGAQALSSHTGVGGGDINVTATYTSAPSAGQLVTLFNQYTPDSGSGVSNISYLMLSAEL